MGKFDRKPSCGRLQGRQNTPGGNWIYLQWQFVGKFIASLSLLHIWQWSGNNRWRITRWATPNILLDHSCQEIFPWLSQVKRYCPRSLLSRNISLDDSCQEIFPKIAIVKKYNTRSLLSRNISLAQSGQEILP